MHVLIARGHLRGVRAPEAAPPAIPCSETASCQNILHSSRQTIRSPYTLFVRFLTYQKKHHGVLVMGFNLERWAQPLGDLNLQRAV